jgi:hypothetical protein
MDKVYYPEVNVVCDEKELEEFYKDMILIEADDYEKWIKAIEEEEEEEE